MPPFSVNLEFQEVVFTVIIDTRGSSYNAIKPILKTLEEGKIPNSKVNHVYRLLQLLLTMPDTFWQKQRTLLAKGKYRFEVYINKQLNQTSYLFEVPS